MKTMRTLDEVTQEALFVAHAENCLMAVYLRPDGLLTIGMASQDTKRHFEDRPLVFAYPTGETEDI